MWMLRRRWTPRRMGKSFLHAAWYPCPCVRIGMVGNDYVCMANVHGLGGCWRRINRNRDSKKVAQDAKNVNSFFADIFYGWLSPE